MGRLPRPDAGQERVVAARLAQHLMLDAHGRPPRSGRSEDAVTRVLAMAGLFGPRGLDRRGRPQPEAVDRVPPRLELASAPAALLPIAPDTANSSASGSCRSAARRTHAIGLPVGGRTPAGRPTSS